MCDVILEEMFFASLVFSVLNYNLTSPSQVPTSALNLLKTCNKLIHIP
jgi:hypothetical protein